ncbi:LamG domain-containing protein [Streptomyces antarcticus]|uniref:LamG domain-containing protein n=1 Tax=Streptomyces antarcticus TaxID=2996458 RepID=UPI002270A57C|nr:LamG domain-containing protein [Streptomyces sp. H34-AA3]MCY0943369.1 LamG domain-containing protein [Streptomyces sp. H34-AA3]
MGGAAIAGAGALVGVARTAGVAEAAETLTTPFTPVSVPHLVQAEQMVQYQRMLAAGYLPAGLTGHWPLDGNGADRSGFERSVALGSGASWTKLRAGGELSFDGSSAAYASTNTVLDTTAPFTVAAWVRLSDDPANPAPLEANPYTAVSQDGVKTSRFLLMYDDIARKWAFKVRSEDQKAKAEVFATTPVVPGQWVHLTGVWDKGNLRIHVNGIQESSGTDATIAWAATQGFNIGRAKWDGAPANRWHGSIDDVRAYNRALTADEISVISGKTARHNNDYLIGETPEVVWGSPADPTTWIARARCSSFITRVLRQTYPAWAATTGTYFKDHFGDAGPEAADYRVGFDADPGPHFKKIRKVADLQPGDLIAVDYQGAVPNNTGHIVMVREVKGVFTGSVNLPNQTQYAVEVIDSTAAPHGVFGLSTYEPYPDSRMVDNLDESRSLNFKGVGIGHMMFYASNATGEFSAYRWSVNSGSDKTYATSARPISAARVV